LPCGARSDGPQRETIEQLPVHRCEVEVIGGRRHFGQSRQHGFSPDSWVGAEALEAATDEPTYEIGEPSFPFETPRDARTPFPCA